MLTVNVNITAAFSCLTPYIGQSPYKTVAVTVQVKQDYGKNKE